MSTPSSCTRCSRPIMMESLGGICTECARFANTPVSGPQATPVSTPPRISDALGQPAPYDPHLDTPTEPSATPSPRSLLPRAPSGYELLERLGAGGMGAVYLAYETIAERRVAMKFLHNPGRMGSLERFFVELRAFAKLNHPNIVSVLSHDFYRADPYITMEHVPGGSLAKRLETNGVFEPHEAARIIAIIARAVHFSHAASVIHRDLKPSNILLTMDGQPKLSDFGLAKRIDREDGVTDASGPLGTPEYMAPEQVRGSLDPVQPTVDVYGLGATLYHLVTGRPPFTGRQPEVFNKILRDLPARPRALRPGLSAGLEAIILKCLEKNPACRYQSAAELADDLDRFLAGQRQLAPELTPSRRAKRWFDRHRESLAWAAAALLLAAIAIGATRPGAPVDEATAIIKETTSGRTAHLFKGNQPRHAKWLIGHGDVLEPTAEAPEFAFFSDNERGAYLELCPDPGVESYTFSAKLKHMGVFEYAPNGLEVGLFFAHERREANEHTAHTCYDVSFSDLPRVRADALRAARFGAYFGVSFFDLTRVHKPFETMKARTHQRFSITSPLQYTKACTTGMGGGPLDPVATTLPGPWRTFDIDVSPQQIVVKCDGKIISDTSRQGFSRQPMPSFLEAYDSYKLGVPDPTFPARAPLGVFVNYAAVAVKDATITPR